MLSMIEMHLLKPTTSLSLIGLKPTYFSLSLSSLYIPLSRACRRLIKPYCFLLSLLCASFSHMVSERSEENYPRVCSTKPPPSSAAASSCDAAAIRSSPCPAVHLAVVLPCAPGSRSNVAPDDAPSSPCRRSAWLPPCLASWYRPDAPASSRLTAAYRPAAASSRRVPACYRVSRIAINATNAYRRQRRQRPASALPAPCSRPAAAPRRHLALDIVLQLLRALPALCCCAPSRCPAVVLLLRSAAASLSCHRPCHRCASLSRRTLPRPAIAVRPTASHRPYRRAPFCIFKILQSGFYWPSIFEHHFRPWVSCMPSGMPIVRRGACVPNPFHLDELSF